MYYLFYSHKTKRNDQMMWYGQYHAILLTVVVVGAIISYIVDNASFGIGIFFLVVLIRICTGIVNTLFKAFLGRPLIYDTKIMVQKDGAGAS